MREHRFMAAVLAATVALALGAIGCGDDDKGDSGGGGSTSSGASKPAAQVKPPKDLKPLSAVGEGEGRVDLIVNRQSQCPTDAVPRPVPGEGTWVCLRPSR